MLPQLARLGACAEGREFAAKFNTLQEAWDACPEAKWMAWLLARKQLRICDVSVLDFVRSVLSYGDQTGVEDILNGVDILPGEYAVRHEYVKARAIDVLFAWRNGLDNTFRFALSAMVNETTNYPASEFRKFFPKAPEL